jgi:tetratricopeptide (TPR) repeat protein
MKPSVRKTILLALALACLIPAVPAAADEPALTRAQARAALKKADPQERRRGALGLGLTGRMDDAPMLVAALRDTDETVRAIAEEALWTVWSRSGDARVDDLFKRGVSEMNAEHFGDAIATFTRIIELKPDFAEGWNKRATAYYLAGEYRRSLADCDQVIKRNPQHFGALSGYGQIYLQLDRPDKALEYFRRALAVNPNMDAVQSMVERIEELEARRRARSI